MRLIIICVALLFSAVTFAQQNCFDGIDNDGDGLVDLNDTDECNCQPEGGELIENGGFESYIACPNSFSGLEATGSFYFTNGGSTDFFHECDYVGGEFVHPNITPLLGGENGSGITGFYSDSLLNYREYITQCLQTPLQPGVTYTLSFDVATTGFFIFDGPGIGYPEYKECSVLPFGLYGSNSCPVETSSYSGCLSEFSEYTGLVEEDVEVLVNEFTTYEFTFTVPQAITSVAFGGGCELPTCQGPGTNSYFYLDNFSIQPQLPAVIEPPAVTVSGNSCQGFSFEAEQSDFDYYQWFVNGIATEGGADLTQFNLPPDSVPSVTLGVTQEIDGSSTSCAFTETFELESLPTFSATATYQEILCPDEITVIELAITPTGNYTIEWSSGETSSTIEGGIGNYSVLITDEETGCEEELEFEITSCFDEDFFVSLVDQEACEGSNFEILAEVIGGTPPFEFEWSPNLGAGPGPYSFEAVDSEEFSVTVTDATGLVTSASANVTVLEEFDIDFSLGPDTSFCEGETLVLSPSPALEDVFYSWSTGSDQVSISLTQGGVYSLTASTACNNFTDEVSVELIELPDLPNFPEAVSLCSDSIIVLNVPVSSDYSFTWSDGSQEPDFLIDSEGIYSVVFEAPCFSASRNIEVEEVACGCNIFIPNAFTPDEDGLNEVFKPTLDCEPQSFSFVVFNRWGQEIFRTNDPNQPWLGDDNGNRHHSGPEVYNYILEVLPSNDSAADPIIRKGSVTVIR